MDQHYVYAQEPLGDEQNRVLKQGDTFAIFDHYGNISTKGLGEQGLYHDGTRFLSGYFLRLEKARPMILNSTIKQDNALLTVDLTNPDMKLSNGEEVKRGTLHLFRAGFLWEGTYYERLRFKSYATRKLEMQLTFFFDSDFADIFEIRGSRRPKRGTALEPKIDRSEVALGYKGLDGVERWTLIHAQPAPAEIRRGQMDFAISLEPLQESELMLTVNCQIEPMAKRTPSIEEAFHLSETSFQRTKDATASISTSHAQFNDWIQRSHADLHMMQTETPFGPYPYAGVPWFSTPFGRDGIITALQCLWFYPSLAKGVLAFLCATQATENNPERDAQPGKIFHETRGGEMAALGEIPFGRYYGSVDATPLFVLLAGAYVDRTGDVEFLKEIWPHVQKALAWIDGDGDPDGDGFVEYHRSSSHGLVQQGWKDSDDSVFHADGKLAEGPIALCEVQGYVYAAKKYAAIMAHTLGDAESAMRLDREADHLQKKFWEAFWCDDLGTFALALDGRKQPCRVRSSNAGQCLFTGIANPVQARRLSDTLLADDSCSGWGIRTISNREARYNPMSYHNGSIWPHDNSLIALGLARHGCKRGALRILDGLFQASLFVNLHRMPELFCGFTRRNGEGPTPYPVACSPQAWAAGSVFLLLEAILGIHIETTPYPKVVLRHPILPELVDELYIQHLQVGDAYLDLFLRRHREDIGVNVLKRDGEVEVVVVK